jgi:hypothetical protein
MLIQLRGSTWLTNVEQPLDHVTLLLLWHAQLHRPVDILQQHTYETKAKASSTKPYRSSMPATEPWMASHCCMEAHNHYLKYKKMHDFE